MALVNYYIIYFLYTNIIITVGLEPLLHQHCLDGVRLQTSTAQRNGIYTASRFSSWQFGFEVHFESELARVLEVLSIVDFLVNDKKVEE